MLFTSSGHLLRVTGVNLAMKSLTFTIVLYLEAQLFKNLHLSGAALASIAAALTVVGTFADLMLVPALGNLPALSLGFFGITFIIWVIALVFPATQVTLVNAMFMALPLGPIEYVLHRYVLDSLVS